jgi:Tfp pilus assembly protein PilN
VDKLSLPLSLCQSYCFTIPKISKRELAYYLETDKLKFFSQFCYALRKYNHEYEVAYQFVKAQKVIVSLIKKEELQTKKDKKSKLITPEFLVAFEYLKSKHKNYAYLMIDKECIFLYIFVNEEIFIREIIVNVLNQGFDDKVLMQINIILNELGFPNTSSVYLCQHKTLIKCSDKYDYLLKDLSRENLDKSLQKCRPRKMLNFVKKESLFKTKKFFNFLLALFIIQISFLFLNIFLMDYDKVIFDKTKVTLQQKQQNQKVISKAIKYYKKQQRYIKEIQKKEIKYFTLIKKLNLLLGKEIVLENISYRKQKVTLVVLTKKIAYLNIFSAKLQKQKIIKKVKIGKLQNSNNKLIRTHIVISLKLPELP